ncbi:hypothetical protein Cgig2_033705 [Carnegiea gigantea]|uniref:Uncharacterized protein n=1 Tax=Carnegiea gigantea TaxID=171969 RepID=A0A9Q1K7X5_9CARY|nr:hypothetical protein Cgig2_033705 [Carnegiea gigantea]
MEDGEEPMRAADANELENATNDNRRRKSVVTITCERKSRTLVSEAEGERQGKAHNKESEPHNNDDLMSQSTEYTVPPKPEPARKKQRKQHHRDSLQPTTKRAPKTTAKKKVQFRHIEVEEPVSANTVDEEDVYATLGLPMGEYEIIEGHSSEAEIEFLELRRRRWNVERAGPPIGSMDEVILDRGGHGQEFITDFITYPISTCIVGNANDTCQSRLFYLFRGRKVERLFPTAINWDTDKVRNRDKEKQEAGEYGKGRIIARIDYEKIVRLAEADLEIYMQELEEDQPQQGAGAMSRATTTKEQRCPYCPHCNAQHDGIVHLNDEPLQSTDKVGGDDNVRAPDDPYYCSPEFLEQVDKLESLAMEQRTRIGYSPSSFNLGLPSERKACATPSGDITPASFQPQMGVYTGSVTTSDSE